MRHTQWSTLSWDGVEPFQGSQLSRRGWEAEAEG